jgi:glucokinase
MGIELSAAVVTISTQFKGCFTGRFAATRDGAQMKPTPANPAGQPGFFVGVDLGRAQITAGVFSEGLRFLGKFKKSVKPERGPDAVIARIARCIEEAVDECDLRTRDLLAVGLGLPGRVDPAAGLVSAAPRLGWENVPLRAGLEKHLSRPVLLENIHSLGALGIYTEEWKAKPRTFAAIFWGTELGAGFCADGELTPSHACPELAAMIVQGQEQLARILPPELRHLRGRDLRKALRRGDAVVRRFVSEAAGIAGMVAANVVENLNPEVLALGGGVMEENKEEWMAIIEERVRQTVSPARVGGTKLEPSALGGNAAMVGGALLARRGSLGV